MSVRSLPAIFAVSLLMLVRAHAGAPAQNPQSTFQAEVNLIEVDAIIHAHRAIVDSNQRVNKRGANLQGSRLDTSARPGSWSPPCSWARRGACRDSEESRRGTDMPS